MSMNDKVRDRLLGVASPLALLLLLRTYLRIAPKTCSFSAFLKVRSWNP